MTTGSISALSRVHFVWSALHVWSNKVHQIARNQWLSVTLIGLLGFGGSAAVGLIMGIPEPGVHDEFSYLLAADTFAQGRLTNPTHPMWVHFESIHIIHQPTYMSKYPPAQGLILALGQVVSGYPILGVWISVGFMCAAICWMSYAWLPPSWALLGGFLVVVHPELGITGHWAQSYWGGAVAAAGGALVVGSLRRILKQQRIQHALLMALGLAVLANSRPYEGLLFSLPAGVLLLLWMVSKNGPAMWVSLRYIVLPIAIVLAVTSLGMALYNLRLTGNIFRLPYTVHEETYAIEPIFLWQTPRPTPIYRHQIIREFHQTMLERAYHRRRSFMGFFSGKKETFRTLLDFYLGKILGFPLLVMFPAMIVWIFKDRWALFALITCGVVVVGFLIETFDGSHYVAPITGLIFVLVLQAMWLWRRRDRLIGQFVIFLMISLPSYWLLRSCYDAMNEDHSSDWRHQRANIIRQLDQKPGRDLIIVRYGPKHSIHEEWVYNRADIDRAKVIWARDMSKSDNDKLFNYFKDRELWLLDLDRDGHSPELQPYVVSRSP